MSGMSLGVPKQYGLIKKPVANQNKGLVANKKPTLFNNDDDDIDEVDDSNDTNAIKRANRFIVSSKSIQQSSAVQDDIAIYDYDGAYDTFKSNDNSNNHPLLSSEGSSNLPKPKPKYIESIIATSKIREKEQERMYERKLMRDRKKEDELYGDTEKFMTSAYKKKLEDEKKWEYEDKLIDIVEQKTDFRSKGMHGFYANLMSKNVATGADVSSNALSAYTAGSSRQSQLENIKNNETNPINNNDNSNSDISKHNSNDDNNINQKRSNDALDTDKDEEVVKKQRVESNEPLSMPSLNDQSKDTNINQVSKEDAIMSAKERYLARKNKTA